MDPQEYLEEIAELPIPAKRVQELEEMEIDNAIFYTKRA